VLAESDMKKISDPTNLFSAGGNSDGLSNFDEEKSFSLLDPWGSEYGEGAIIEGRLGIFGSAMYGYANTTHSMGNIRVLRLY